MGGSSVLRSLSRLWRQPEQIGDVDGLREFLKAEAAFLSQKATIEYCRARTGFNWDKLFKEQAFRDALEICRWEALAAILADLLIVTESYLRPHGDTEVDRLGMALSMLFDEILNSYQEATTARGGWADLAAAFPVRVARAQLGPPHDPAEIAKTGGDRVFELLPIHGSLRTHDREMVINNVRFGTLAFWQKLPERIQQPAPLARRLIAFASPSEQDPIGLNQPVR